MWPFNRSKKLEQFDLKGSWKSHEIWFIDGEMTGLDPNKDELLNLVAVPMREGRLLLNELKQWVIEPTRPLGINDAVQHHHITPSLLKNATPPHLFSQQIKELLDHKIIAGHFVDLDLAFLNQLTSLNVISIDTAKLFRSHQSKLNPHFPPEALSLSHVAQILGSPSWGSHIALNDILTCACCFLKMAHDLEYQRIHELEELLRLS
jgi:DNA polymerase III subunit epsilon